jgi:predicted transcriptional regulator
MRFDFTGLCSTKKSIHLLTIALAPAETIDAPILGCYLCNTHPKEFNMAATATLKLPEELKARIAPLADSSAKTPHAWMIEALEAQARLAEMRQSFIGDALASAAEVDAGGALFAMQDVHEYIISKAADKPAKRPKPASIAKSKPRTKK